MFRVDEEFVDQLAIAMGENGQQTPIEVHTENANGLHVLIAGGHRMACARKLGWSEIEAFIEDVDDDEALLREIDENLYRHELNAFDQARFLAERRDIFERCNGEVGVGRKKSNKINSEEIPQANAEFNFFDATAQRFGMARRTIELGLTRWTRIIPEGIDPGFDYNIGKAWKDFDLAKGGPTPGATVPPSLKLPKSVLDPHLRGAPPAYSAEDLRSFLKKPEGRVTIGDLPADQMKFLDARRSRVALSDQTMAKQERHHPDLAPSDYERLHDLIASPDAVLDEAPGRIVLLKKAGAIYTAALKTTQDGGENFLLSFRKAKDKDVLRLLRKLKLLAGAAKNLTGKE